MKPLQPMDLGTIFENTVSLIGRTFVRNLLIAAAFMAIPLVLLAFAATGFYSTVFNMQNSVLEAKAQGELSALLPVLGTLVFFFAATMIFGLATLLADIAIRIVVHSEMQSQPVSFQEAITQTFDQKWIRAIGLTLLMMIVLVGIVIVTGIVVAVMMAISGILGGLMVASMVMVGIPAMLFLVFKWYFAVTAIAVENMDVFGSMRRSWYLVEDNWWRTFGIIVLFSILTQFVISIVSLPITFGTMWNVYKDFFTMVGQTGGNIDPEKLQQLQQSFGPGVAIGSGISGILTLLIAPVYSVVLFCDLRARKTPPVEELPQDAPLDAGTV